MSPVLADGPLFTPLGDLPGGTFYSFAGDVSADGSVVVGWSTSSCLGPNSCNAEAFRWQDGIMTGLGFPPNTAPLPYSEAQAVSADGSIFAGSASFDEGTSEPTRWENGIFTPLGRIPGYGNNFSLTADMSDDGRRIVGWQDSADGNDMQAWLWDNGSTMGLGSLGSPYMYSAANGISGDGNVVVGGSYGEAFRWENGAMTGLGFLPSPFPDPPGEVVFESSASAASFDGGVIVGSSRAFDYQDRYQHEAFRWSDGVMIGLGDLPGGDFNSGASAVSADGSIIVGHGTNSSGQVPFIWDSVHGMRDLRQMLENAGLNLTGWTLNYVTNISADGTVIVGTGINPAGNYEAFRVVVPEPAALSLLAIGPLLVGATRPKTKCF